jgi:hypothetical protein
MRLTWDRNPKVCDMCDRLEDLIEECKSLKSRCAAEPNNTELKAFRATRMMQLNKALKHRRDLAHQRSWIETNIENKLVPGQCLLYWDYFSFYPFPPTNPSATVHDLVMVIKFRLCPGGAHSLCVFPI